MSDPRAEALREAIGAVIDRWYHLGLIRFNSHDDGGDDLLLRDELARAALALPAESALAYFEHDHFRKIAAEFGDIDRLARSIHATKGGGPFGVEGDCECREDAEAIAAEYAKLARREDG